MSQAPDTPTPEPTPEASPAAPAPAVTPDTPSKAAIEETRGFLKDELVSTYRYDASDLEGMNIQTLSKLHQRERRLAAAAKDATPHTGVEPIPAKPAAGTPGAVTENPELKDYVVTRETAVNTTVQDQGYDRRAMEVFEAAQGKFPAPSRVKAYDAAPDRST